MKRNRVFRVALAGSILFHLSMVTVFRIVIHFPKEDIRYFQVGLVEASPVDYADAPLPPQADQLRTPSPEDAFARGLADEILAPAELFAQAPPAIQLPTIEFAGQDLLRLRTKGLEIRSQYEELFEDAPQDTWERFGKGLSTIGTALSEATIGRLGDDDEVEPVSHPAPGFEAYIEWMDPPYERMAVSVSKVEKLWGMNPRNLPEPIALFFKVNPQGQVVRILPQMEDEEGIVESAVESLFQYRFEDLSTEVSTDQNGTFIIRAAGRGR